MNSKRCGFLASVTSTAEALLAREAGANMIDCKNPQKGALGALPLMTVRAIVKALDGEMPVSTTVGNITLDPAAWEDATNTMSASGADIIKIGLQDPGNLKECLQKVLPLAELYPLVAVLFADQPLIQHSREEIIALLAEHQFLGVMLDCSDKSSGSLTQQLTLDEIKSFVETAHQADLMCGLAGALQLADIEKLKPLNPDYLGFRSALCQNGERNNDLDPQRVAQVAERLK
jgi:dihydroneopterin aldolase